MPGRKYSSASGYRYGFNGKENDNEVKGEGNQQDYGQRIYDTRLGRFLSTDPFTKIYPELTPYQFASNRPIDGIDLDGLEWHKAVKDWASNLTIAGFLYNTSNSVKAAANGDQRALVGLISYTGSKTLEGKEAFGASGTRDQKEYFLTSIFLDAATAYALPKLAPKNAPSAVKLSASEEGAAAPRSSTAAATNKQVTSANGGNASPAQSNIEAIAAPVLGKIGRRKLYAENTFKDAGKSASDVDKLMRTVDFKRAVSEKVLNVGDKVYRFERINSKGGEMHFFTDAIGADAGATGVGFASAEGYKLVTYEVTQKTNVMESTIKGTGNKQYFSTELQKNIKKVGEE
ncbi:MAG TPA: RHS repeat-associated core domain-containing protein [Chitinophagaceae bacterium]|nr:RHS repeat-associated core domain-containing protein [Chitinophagaceae bacterium]